MPLKKIQTGQMSCTPPLDSLVIRFHTYALEWLPNSINWFIDDHLYQTVTADEWFSSGGLSPALLDESFHLLMNLAVGGNWPGYPDETVTFPQELLVDFVRVYQLEE